MKKSNATLLSMICLLAGIILGFLIAPAQGGIGNTTHNNYKFSDSQEENETE